jgi:6-phosphogluconolactonase (cycloisomerase 2 family)
VDHSGKFLYVADQQSNQVSGYSISSSTGTLTALSTPTISTGVNPVWLAIHPGGLNLYVANNGAASISAYTINATSGVLGVVGSPFATGGQPSAIALK